MFFILVGVVTRSRILNNHYTVDVVLAARSGHCWVPAGFRACQQPPPHHLPLYDLLASAADSCENIGPTVTAEELQ